MTKATIKDFNIGDRVKVIGGGDTDVGGNIGIHRDTVTTVSDIGGGFVYVDGKKRSSGKGLCPANLEVVKEDTRTVSGFKIGDTVEVTMSGYGVGSDDKGKTAKVAGFSGSRILIDGSHFTFPYTSYTDKSRISCNPLCLKKVNVIDFTKPVFTAEGTPVEILTTEGRDPKFPVLAYEGAATQTSKYTAEGVSSTGVARRNLTNKVPVVETVRFHNVYKNSLGVLYTGDGHFTAEDARSNANKGAVGLVKVVMVEGQFAA